MSNRNGKSVVSQSLKRCIKRAETSEREEDRKYFKGIFAREKREILEKHDRIKDDLAKHNFSINENGVSPWMYSVEAPEGEHNYMFPKRPLSLGWYRAQENKLDGIDEPVLEVFCKKESLTYLLNDGIERFSIHVLPKVLEDDPSITDERIIEKLNEFMLGEIKRGRTNWNKGEVLDELGWR